MNRLPRPPDWKDAPADATFVAYRRGRGWEWLSGNEWPSMVEYAAVILREMAEDLPPEAYEAMLKEKFS